MPRTIKPPELRVQRFLAKLPSLPGWNFSDLNDARQAAKCRHPLSAIIWAALLGLLTNKKTLRDVEKQTRRLSKQGHKLIPQPISDTTLHTELTRLDEADFEKRLIAQIRGLYRQKRLTPFGVPCGVATVDGKNLATLSHHADGTGHKRSKETDKWAPKPGAWKAGVPYWLMPAIRVALTSAQATPCIYQQRLLPGQGEQTVDRQIVDALHQAYGRSGMIEVMDFDAGFTSLALADYINQRGYAYVFGLKANQGTLYAAAVQAFKQKVYTEDPEAITPWERRNGSRIRRLLYRTDGLNGLSTTSGTWRHLRQTWLVRQETELEDGTLQIEDRYFISSLLWQRFKPQQILTLVRGHWAIENQVFNSLDLQWREDHAPWCTQGYAIWILGWLRLMAYNVAQLLRQRILCRRSDRHRGGPITPWRQLFEWVTESLSGTQQFVVVTVTPD